MSKSEQPTTGGPSRRASPIAVLMVVAWASPARAQDVEPDRNVPVWERWSEVERAQLTGKVGYLFGANISTPRGTLRLNDGVSYGVALDVLVPGFILAEASYALLPTSVDLEEPGATREIADVNVHYLQLGFARDFLPGKVRPFFAVTGGATGFGIDAGYDDEWRIALSVGAGVKVLPTPKIGIRFEGRVVNTFIGSASDIFCGFGGCSTGVVGSSLLQPELTAGVFTTF